MPDANVVNNAAASEVQTETKPHAYASLADSNPANGEETHEEEVDASGQPVGEGGKGKRPIQPRINELVRKQREAERQADYWRGVAEGRTANTKAPVDTTAAAPSAAPKPDKSQFSNYDEYVEALTEWKADIKVQQALEKVNTKIEARESQQSTAQIQENRAKNWKERSAATREVLSDFDDVLSAAEGAVIEKHVADLLEDSPHGPALAYKMAKDPELLDKLNKLGVAAAAKEFGRMEAVFDGAAEPTPSTKSVKTSNAPKPPSTRMGGAAATKAMGNMSMDEYIEARRQQGAFGGPRK